MACASAALATAPAHAATLTPGDVLVADISALDGTGGIFKVDPAGQQSIVSSNALNTGTDYFEDPTDVAFDAAGLLLVADYTPSSATDGRVIRVDPTTGQQTLVSDNTISTANLLRGPFGIAVEASGRILVADFLGGAVIGVDPNSGEQTVVSDNTVSTADLMGNPAGLAIGAGGQILVADESGSGGPVTGSVYGVDPTSGQQTAISDNVINTPGTDYFDSPHDLVLDSAGRILVADPVAPPGGANDGAVVRVDPANGQQTLVSDNAVSTQDLFDGHVYPIALESSGSILVGDEGTPGEGELVRVDPASGQQSAMTDNTINIGTDLLFAPYGLLVVPTPPPAGSAGGSAQPRSHSCRGREATRLGTEGADILRGTAGPDVFAGLGGRDTIRGVGGADVACGGGARDRIFGGAGGDLLVGEAGGDLLSGGAGKDKLVGGAGGDRLLGGPRIDRLNGGPGKDRTRQ